MSKIETMATPVRMNEGWRENVDQIMFNQYFRALALSSPGLVWGGINSTAASLLFTVFTRTVFTAVFVPG